MENRYCTESRFTVATGVWYLTASANPLLTDGHTGHSSEWRIGTFKIQERPVRIWHPTHEAILCLMFN